MYDNFGGAGTVTGTGGGRCDGHRYGFGKQCCAGLFSRPAGSLLGQRSPDTGDFGGQGCGRWGAFLVRQVDLFAH